MKQTDWRSKPKETDRELYFVRLIPQKKRERHLVPFPFCFVCERDGTLAALAGGARPAKQRASARATCQAAKPRPASERSERSLAGHRNVATGSALVARRAGKYAAAAPISVITTIAPASTLGSNGLT